MAEKSKKRIKIYDNPIECVKLFFGGVKKMDGKKYTVLFIANTAILGMTIAFTGWQNLKYLPVSARLYCFQYYRVHS
jgi:hypothetical protein